MTPAERKAFILALDDSTPTRIAAKAAFAAGDSGLCASLLSAPTEPGRVPTVEVARYVYDTGVYGKAAVITHLPVPTDPQQQQFYGLCSTIMGMLRDLPDINVRGAAFQTGLSAFVSQTWIDQATADAVTALGLNRTPLLACTDAQVGEARNA